MIMISEKKPFTLGDWKLIYHDYNSRGLVLEWGRGISILSLKFELSKEYNNKRLYYSWVSIL